MIAVLVLTGILLVKIGRLLLAAATSLLTWVLLGFLGVCIAEQPRAADHGISLVEQGHLPLGTPLRGHGHIRDEPTRLLWGYGYEIELSNVAFEDALHAARGGLRLSFTAHTEGAPPPDFHAGDEVAVLTEAQRPQVFRDEGAFDRRTYLAQQDIDLVATLRAPELVVRIASQTPTIGTVLTRARRRLREEREEIDELFSSTPQAAGVLRAMLSVTGVSWIRPKWRIFRRRASFTYWLWQVCKEGLSRSLPTGWDGSCDCHESGRCCSR